MLARLLRRILFTQMALGALLGWAASQWYGGAVWLLVGAIALPCATLVGVNLVSALKSRAAGEPAAHWWRAWLGETVAEFQTFVLRQPWTVQAPTVLPATGGTPQLPVVLVHGYLCDIDFDGAYYENEDFQACLMAAYGFDVDPEDEDEFFTKVVQAFYRQYLPKSA